jgi:transposase
MLALLRHAGPHDECRFSGAKPKRGGHRQTVAFDPGCVKTLFRCYDSPGDSVGELMRRFVEEADRGQWTLLPECLDDFIDDSNPVRVIDVFVDALDLAEMSFDGVEPAATGRPSYHPSVLLKLYIYGYLNRVQSSRRLEREAGRNVEVMWLLGRLAPDHKTIADFRKDNGLALRKVCARFVELCREMGLLATASVAIDGSKFKAVNNRDKNFTRAKVERRRAQLEESVARYLSQLDTADRQEPTEALAARVTRLKEKLVKVKEAMGKLAVYERQMLASPDQQISLTDPDSRSMATSGRGSGVVGYNVQIAVDTEHHLIVAHEVTNSGSDRAQLANMASRAKDVLGVEKLEAVADRGYYSGEEILACDKAGIAVTLPKTDDIGSRGTGSFWQTGLCPSQRRGCVSLSGWRKVDLPLHQRRGWAAAPTLLDQRVPRLCAQSWLYDWQGAADHALGA